jgi:molybdenum cofactor biosynthesis protein B
MSNDPQPEEIVVHLMTISDSRTETDDQSGQLMRDHLEEAGYVIDDHTIQRENLTDLRNAFADVIDDERCDVVISTGGTGISSRDQTLEAVEELIDKPLPGFGELFRQLSREEVGPYTVMSRATAGRARDTMVIALPGSTNAVELALDEIILEILPHMVKEINKEQ